jgi:hypothetical protein
LKSDFELKLPDLNLNDLLRSGFAGAFFILVAATSFNDPGQLLKDNKDVAGALVALGVPVSLTIGTVIYALHRAIPFQGFYWICAVVVHLLHALKNKSLHGWKNKSTRELDITRWKNHRKENSLQRRLVEWASQIHFLYCLSWSSKSALCLGDIFMWEQSSTYFRVQCLFWFFLLSALFHHARYLWWEIRVFEEDSNLMV